jgi:CDP-glucose 4,6-dehydratase
MRSLQNKQSLEIRSPSATRPWQHVTDCLSGYLTLGEKLLNREGDFASAWNFGPDSYGNCTVEQVVQKLAEKLENLYWYKTKEVQPHEEKLLYLDTAKAQGLLHWRPVWSIDCAITKTAEWYQAWRDGKKIITRTQLNTYIEDAARAKVDWIAM